MGSHDSGVEEQNHLGQSASWPFWFWCRPGYGWIFGLQVHIAVSCPSSPPPAPSIPSQQSCSQSIHPILFSFPSYSPGGRNDNKSDKAELSCRSPSAGISVKSWKDSQSVIFCVSHSEIERSKVCYISVLDSGSLTLDKLCFCLTPLCSPYLHARCWWWPQCWADMAETSKIQLVFTKNCPALWPCFLFLSFYRSLFMVKTPTMQNFEVRGDDSSCPLLAQLLS